MMSLVLNMMVGLVIGGGIGLLLSFIITKSRPTCARPLPGPKLVWDRCSVPCDWCDHMERLDRQKPSEDRSTRARGPYRTLSPALRKAEEAETLLQICSRVQLEGLTEEEMLAEIICFLVGNGDISPTKGRRMMARVSGDPSWEKNYFFRHDDA